MADPGLRRSSLDHRADDFRQACAADLSIRELTFQAQTILRGDPDDPGFRTGCAGILGCALPLAPNTVGASGSLTVLWLGPDEWLIVGPDGSGDPIRAGLRDALAGLHAAVVDMDAARTVIELHGGSGTAVLESVCVLDLHPRVFPPGGCAQTMIGPAQIVLLMRNDAPTWWVFVRNSYADWLTDWLLDAIRNAR